MFMIVGKNKIIEKEEPFIQPRNRFSSKKKAFYYRPTVKEFSSKKKKKTQQQQKARKTIN